VTDTATPAARNLKQKPALSLDDKAIDATEFKWLVRVYWEDTDAGGIVFYANYLKYFERARTEWLRQLGLGQQALREQTGGMFVVTDVQLKYHRPARLDDLLCVTAQLQHAGRASLTLRQTACWVSADARTGTGAGTSTPGAASATAPTAGLAEPRTLLCEGQVRIGWVDATQMRPQRIPASVLLAIQRQP
jgi:acyl-CoA thioester hydrolase